jgi:hypothetical protein
MEISFQVCFVELIFQYVTFANDLHSDLGFWTSVYTSDHPDWYFWPSTNLYYSLIIDVPSGLRKPMAILMGFSSADIFAVTSLL